MEYKIIEKYWNDENCFLAFFGDVRKVGNITIAREAEYHNDNGDIVIVDVFWNENDNIVGCHSIDQQTLKYDDECDIQPEITREEYDTITDIVRKSSYTDCQQLCSKLYLQMYCRFQNL